MNFRQKLLIAGVAMVPILAAGSVALATASNAASGTDTQAVATQEPGTAAQDAAEPAGTMPEATSSTDLGGSGGHEDSNGGNADHQFQGRE